MYVYIGGNKLPVTLWQNDAVTELLNILSEGDLTYTADDYGDFEKVGYIGRSLPRSDEHISVSAGDVVLYQGNQISIFYDSSSWSYTRIGRIEGYSSGQLRTLLCAGNGEEEVRLSLE